MHVLYLFLFVFSSSSEEVGLDLWNSSIDVALLVDSSSSGFNYDLSRIIFADYLIWPTWITG